MVFSWLFRGPLLSRKTVFGPFSLLFRGFFVAFSWLFRGPCFGQILRVLALEQSSEREQAILRKSKAPRKSPEKWTFSEPCLNSVHLVCTLSTLVSSMQRVPP